MQLTTANKILVAAARLDAEKDTFTAEDLIVRAWKDYPDSFGLSGYTDRYPDSNRVLAKLMGSVGLCNRGWLEQISTKTYKMTPSGRKYAASLEAGDSPRAKLADKLAERERERDREREREKAQKRAATPAPAKAPKAPSVVVAPKTERSVAALDRAAPVTPKGESKRAVVSEPKAAPPPPPVESVAIVPAAPLTAEEVVTLGRLVTSVGNQKWARGAMVTFQDACSFWGVSPAVHAARVAPRLEEVDALLQRAQAQIQFTRAGLRVNDRLEVSLTQVIGLHGLHRTMMQKYHRELEAARVRARRDEDDDE